MTTEPAADRNVVGFEIALRYSDFPRQSNLMKFKLTKVFQKVPEGYIGFVEELPGANTQGETLEETKANLEEATEVVMETNRQLFAELS
jgi:predicted RNase H-like HicB family nuclease